MLGKKTVLLSSVARNDFALRKSLQLFGAVKVYVFRSPLDAIDDDVMRLDIKRNITKIREFYTVEEIEVDIYAFYENVKVAKRIIQDHPDDRVVIDVTGGDRAVAFALIYATLLLDRRNEIIMVYFKRPEHVGEDLSYVPLPHLPPLTERELEFMQKMGTEATVESIMKRIGTSKSYTWNVTNSLVKKGLIAIDKSTGIVTSKFPGNVYEV